MKSTIAADAFPTVQVALGVFIVAACGVGCRKADTKSAPAAGTSVTTTGGALSVATGSSVATTSLPPSKAVAKGAVGGSAFVPRIASEGPMMKDGRVTLNLIDTEACGEARDGQRILGVTVAWKEGATVDLSAQTVLDYGWAKAPGPVATFVTTKYTKNGTSFSSSNAPVPGFAPKGKLTVVSAPTKSGSMGLVHVDLTSGDYSLKGDIDVKVCFDLVPPK